MKRLLFLWPLAFCGCARDTKTNIVKVPSNLKVTPTPNLNPGVSVITKSFHQSSAPLPVGDARFNKTRPPARGKVFLIASITATYDGEGTCPISHNEFRLRAHNRIYKSSPFFEMPVNFPLIEASLTRAEFASGNIIFEVEPDVTAGKIEYRRSGTNPSHAQP